MRASILLMTLAALVAGCVDRQNEIIWACGDEKEQPVGVGEVTLNVLAEGCGPTIVLLHGFPEFSFSWDGVRDRLSGDFQIVAPDQRGFHLSDIPELESDYRITHLVADVAGLIDTISPGSKVVLVGHDWGAAVAWLFAHQHPELLRGLVIINGPHPDVFARELAENPDQLSAAQYMNVFMSPLAEDLLSANNYQGLIDSLGGALSASQEAQYRNAYAIPGALTGMLNWYRANIDEGPTPRADWPTDVTIEVPTLVMWGMQDGALLPSNVDGLDAFVSDLQIREFPNADHWVPRRDPDGVAAEIRGFVDYLDSIGR